MLDAAENENYAVVTLRNFTTAYTVDPCTFAGSLTMTPCSQEVKQVVSTDVMKALLKQIGEYREMCEEKLNIRSLQNMNEREIYVTGRQIVSLLYRLD